ncbi:unnamed protein product [Effrenium voratum]|nr:unnamed protein product [Effrenium voratum]
MPVTRLAEMAMQARLQGLRRFAAPARPAKAAKAAPRWPFLRLRALSAELQTFLAGEGGELWVTGSPGSGASTAILSVLPNHPAVVLDAEKGEQQMQDTFRRQLAEQLGDREELAEECIAAVLEEHPQAGEALVATVERAARLGLPAALPAGTEVPACRELAQKHRTQPQRLCSSACGVLLQQQRLQLQPASRLHVALALLSEAGRREGGVAGALDFLLAAAKRSRLTLVLLRAQLAPRFLQRATETRAGGSLRLLAQSYDGLAALRARESGVPVLTAEEWSEEMARAIFQPRFIPEEDQRDWRAVWAAVGGHPAHLRQLAELLVEERKQLDERRRQEELEEVRQERQREENQPMRSPDAEYHLQIAKQQLKDDSFRADARVAQGAVEQLLSRLPELLEPELQRLERDLQRFAHHPTLRGVLPERPAAAAAHLGSRLQVNALPLPGSMDEMDPFVLAMLETGLLIPKFQSQQLVVPNQLTRQVLAAWRMAGEVVLDVVSVGWPEAAWAGAHCNSLPFGQWLERMVQESLDVAELPSSTRIYVPEQLVAGDQNAQAGYGIIVNGVKLYSRENIGYVLIENPKKDDLNAAIIASSELSEHQACASECYNFLAGSEKIGFWSLVDQLAAGPGVHMERCWGVQDSRADVTYVAGGQLQCNDFEMLHYYSVCGKRAFSSAIGRLQADLDGAMGVMRDNMRNMAERDGQLHDLEGKSNSLHMASGTFSAHATRLRKEQEWQRCKTRIAIFTVVLSLVWLLMLWLMAGKRGTFVLVSAAVLLVVLPIAWICVRRWRRLEEQEGFREAPDAI